MNWLQRYGTEKYVCNFTPSSPPQGILVFVTVGGEKGAGHFLLAGGEEEVAELGPKLAVTSVPNSLMEVFYSLLQGSHHLGWKRWRSQRSLPRQSQSHRES